MPSYRIRVHSNVGRYPKGETQIGDDFMLFREGLYISCVQNRMVSSFGKEVSEQPVFELENWTSNELRFFSSLYLSCGPYRRCQLYPLPTYKDIEVDSSAEIHTSSQIYVDLITNLHNDQHLMRGNTGLIPTSAEDYETFAFNKEHANYGIAVWDALHQDNKVALRGLYSLLKSEMLFQHSQFQNASIAETHISLDAAHCLVRQTLQDMGKPNPSSIDAGRYIDDTFGQGRSNRGFFADFYEDRIRNTHADNRFGQEVIPSFSVDDIWFLQSNLRELFFFLLTGLKYETLDQ